MKRTKLSKPLSVVFLVATMLSSFLAHSTVVQFETNLGNFEISLYDNDTPLTVANFLRYVDDGDYSDIVFHRAVPGFILQSGGFDTTLSSINANPVVNNEPVFSNVRATIAMAKLEDNPNSATNQWFINIADNGANLDNQNNGFTVFGQVIGDGMTIVDSVMNVPRFNLGAPFTDIPLQNFTVGNEPDATNFIVITSIQVTDTAVDTTAGLTRPLSTKANNPANPEQSSGGGVFNGLLLSFLLMSAFRKRKYVCSLVALKNQMV